MEHRLGSVVLVLLMVSALPTTLSITTTHHDKPEAAKIPVIVEQMKATRKPLQVNRTLEVSERQKRLLPYMTFYMEHDFNRPQHTQRPQPVTLKPTFQQFQNKFNELTGINYVPKYVDQVVPSQKTYPTPFSDNNALPGPFIPMRNSLSPQEPPQPAKVTYTQQYQTVKLPNYSAIYDKLSQLKLQQQQYNQLVQTYSNYNQPYVRKPQEVNFVPLREVPPKTVVHTYTPENIDIPNYYQPIRTYTEQQYQAEIQAPHLDHVQPVTEEEQQQYIEDQKYTIGVKKQPGKPIILLRQKTRLIPQKPVVIIQRRPVQKPYTLEIQPGKYEAARVHPVRYENLPKFELTSNYKTITNPESYDVEPAPPKYIRLIPKYEPKPTYVTVTPKYVQPDNTRYNGPQILTYQGPKVQTPVYEDNYEEQKQPTYLRVPEEPPVTAYQDEPEPTPSYPKLPEPTKPASYSYAPSYAPAYVAPVTDYSTPVQTKIPVDDSNSLSVILKKLQDTNALPQTLTPDNIDNSIRTLVKILSSLKKQQRFMRPIVVPDESGEYDEDIDNEAGVELGETPGAVGPGGTISHIYPENTPEGGTPGKPGVDYPALSSIPQTSFNCKTQRYKGFFGDPDTNCQVWHYCDLNGGQASFLCPNGTIFSQVALTCDWWYNVKCANTPQQYVLNERLYKYILPLAPKFPEDYSGPLVDRYLAMKFQEMEEKMKKERKKNKENSSDEGAEMPETGDDADELSREEQKKQTAIAASLKMSASGEEQTSTEK